MGTDCRPGILSPAGLWRVWLAGVRNHAGIKPSSERRGLPADVSGDTARAYEDDRFDAHNASCLTLAEMVESDFDAMTEDRRVRQQTVPLSSTWAATYEHGQGTPLSYPASFGEHFFSELAMLRASGAERIVFWFNY